MKSKQSIHTSESKDKRNLKNQLPQEDILLDSAGKPIPSIFDTSAIGSTPRDDGRYTIHHKAIDENDDIHDEYQSVGNLHLDRDDYDRLDRHAFVDSVGQDTHGMIDDIVTNNARAVGYV